MRSTPYTRCLIPSSALSPTLPSVTLQCLLATPAPQLCVMTNWHDPAVVKAQNGLFVFWPWNSLPMQVLRCSCSCKIYPCLGWRLYVSYIVHSPVHSPDVGVTHHLPAGRFYPTSATSIPSLRENAGSLGPSQYVRSLPSTWITGSEDLLDFFSFIWDVVGALCFRSYPSVWDSTGLMKLTAKYGPLLVIVALKCGS